jgi:hypothetical protein
MSGSTLTLSPIYDSSLELASTEDTCSLVLVAGDDLVLELTPLIAVGGSGGRGVVSIDTTSLGFGSAATVAMFSTGAADVLEFVDIVVDTAFDGAGAAMTVGTASEPDKYVAAGDVDLALADCFRIHRQLPAQGVESLQISFTAGAGASAGAARVIVHYAEPA